MNPDEPLHQERRRQELLRRVMATQADRVNIASDALASIRIRVEHANRMRRRLTMSLAAVATSAAASVTAIFVGLGACTPPGGTPTPADTATTPVATDTATLEPSPSSTTAALPVYYVAQQRNRPVLYREFRTLTLDDHRLAARIEAAAQLSLAGDALDPDYTSAWPASAGVLSVHVDTGVAVIDLGGARQNSVGSEYAHAAIQQVVWTATAVAADYGTQLTGVRLRFDGQTLAELWGHVGGLDQLLHRADALSTLAPVWLISPQHGDTLARTFTVHIDGALFEATAQLRARNSAGKIVLDRYVTLSVGGPGRGDAQVSVTLPAAGTYTLEAFYYSAADGSVQGLDNHVVTVR